MGLISGIQEIPPTCQPEKDNNPKKKMVKGYKLATSRRGSTKANEQVKCSDQQ